MNFIVTNKLIVFIGPICVGKGTQAQRLATKLNISTLSSGDLFRGIVQKDGEIGRKMKEYMDAGQLIPDSLTKEVMRQELSEIRYRCGLILDGYPRNIGHLEILESIANELDKEVFKFVIFSADKEILAERVTRRKLCRNCNKVFNPSTYDEECCDNKQLYTRSDDTVEAFEKRYKTYQDETVPLINIIRDKYKNNFIEVNVMGKTENIIQQEIFQKLSKDSPNCELKRSNIGSYKWLKNFMKTGSDFTMETVRFFRDWALDENASNSRKYGSLLRRVIYLMTTNLEKYKEYIDIYKSYGIEVINLPHIDNPEKRNIFKRFLYELDGLIGECKISVICLMEESMKLVRPFDSETMTNDKIEEYFNNSKNDSSVRDGVSTVNVAILTTYLKDDTVNKYIGTVKGKINCSKKEKVETVFGWDDIFEIEGISKTLHELRYHGLKHSARDIVNSDYIKDYIYYKTKNNLKFNPITDLSNDVDFSQSPIDFFKGIDLYNNNGSKKSGLNNIINRMLISGIFLRAASSRRVGIYWNPGINGGLPLVEKKDKIHEVTYMAHDIGHQILPDLVFTGKDSFFHRQVYIYWRMMSESFTMTLADMIYIDSLKNEDQIPYDYTARKIHPLFVDLGIDVSSTCSNRIGNIRKVIHANYMYCLNGDDSEYRIMLDENNKGYENLEKFKEKYMPFFVEDFKWTEKNYDNMVETRYIETEKWFLNITELRTLIIEASSIFSKPIIPPIQSIDEFMSKVSRTSLCEDIFNIAFNQYVVPTLIGDYSSAEFNKEIETNRDVIQFISFTKWIIGQLSICFKYDFLKESKETFELITSKMKSYNYRITIDQINDIRTIYNNYLEFLQKHSLISKDDFNTFKQVYPMFDPTYICYDKDINEYEDLAQISDRVLCSELNHFSKYIRQVEDYFNTKLTDSMKKYLISMYKMIEAGGGQIRNGIFVTSPGIMLLTDSTDIDNIDHSVSILITGQAIETSLEFIAHGEAKCARLTSSKTNACNFPMFSVVSGDYEMMKAVKRYYMTRTNELKSNETRNMTFPCNKGSFMVYTVKLSDLHNILIGRAKGSGNETQVIEIAHRIISLLHPIYPNFIKDLSYYLDKTVTNTSKYNKNMNEFTKTKRQEKKCKGYMSGLTDNTHYLFKSLNISTETPDYIQLAEFCARITYLAFSNKMNTPEESIKYIENIVCNHRHFSVLQGSQLIRIEDGIPQVFPLKEILKKVINDVDPSYYMKFIDQYLREYVS